MRVKNYLYGYTLPIGEEWATRETEEGERAGSGRGWGLRERDVGRLTAAVFLESIYPSSIYVVHMTGFSKPTKRARFLWFLIKPIWLGFKNQGGLIKTELITVAKGFFIVVFSLSISFYRF
jgi:hypothetical protein